MASAQVDAASTWIDAALRRHQIQRTGPVELVRERPWATVRRVETDHGTVWMKACGRGTAFEAGLYGLLADATPEHVLAPLAIDTARGWLLLPDGGTSLSAAAGDDTDAILAGLRDALTVYAELQLTVAPHVEALAAVGVADMRPAMLPARFDEALAATRAYARRDGADSADAARHAGVAALRPRVAAWSEQLAAAPGDATLDHNDLHGENVLVDGPVPRFYDFGDAVVAHPFASALIPITFARDHVLGDGTADDDPRLLALRDAFLQPHADALGATVDELVPTLELACRLAKIARTLIWQRAIDGFGNETPERRAAAPLATLTSLLDDAPYGGA